MKKKSEKSLKNLEKRAKWQKGQSGNPKGRPSLLKRSYTQIVNDILDSDEYDYQMSLKKKGEEPKIKAYEIKNDNGTIKELQVAALFEEAFINGNLNAHKMIIELSEKAENSATKETPTININIIEDKKEE
jgi:hypothetical protein